MLSKIQDVIKDLCSARDHDKWRLSQLLKWIVTESNAAAVPEDAKADVSHAHHVFALEKVSGTRANVSVGFLVAALVSSQDRLDVHAQQPFGDTDKILGETTNCVLLSTRVCLLNRVISKAAEVVKALERGAPREAISSKCDALATQLCTGRHYFNNDDLTFDPRFAVFEFTHGLLLRKMQVELVREFVDSVRSGRPRVRQMIMGGGKTTVVAPLLALLLGDGSQLVVLTMPHALLEQSRATLRAAFSSVLTKTIILVQIERASEVDFTLVEKLETARSARGIVLATAQSLKSLYLKILERCYALSVHQKAQPPAVEASVRALVAAVRIFQSGCLIMDEVHHKSFEFYHPCHWP